MKRLHHEDYKYHLHRQADDQGFGGDLVDPPGKGQRPVRQAMELTEHPPCHTPVRDFRREESVELDIAEVAKLFVEAFQGPSRRRHA